MFYDTLESEDPELREQKLMADLPVFIHHAQTQSPAYAKILANVDANGIWSRQALAALPIVRKSQLSDWQSHHWMSSDPMGGFATVPFGSQMPRVFASPGPIYEPQGPGANPWRMARALHAAGFRRGDLIHNAFSHHFTPAGAIMETGAHALGCTVFPAGPGQTELQLEAIKHLRPIGYVGTCAFLKILLEKAEDAWNARTSFRKALLSGDAYPPHLRSWFADRGVDAFECYASADAGLIAYQTESREGLVLSESVILEIVRPGTGELVADGEVGEVVITVLNRTYPLIRFATGDLSAILPGHCPSGRTNTRIRGWMGRTDQSTKVRGMFIHPAQVQQVIGRFPEVIRARVVVSGEPAREEVILKAESAGDPTGLEQALADAFRQVTKLRAGTLLVPVGSLPGDGRMIEDVRGG